MSFLFFLLLNRHISSIVSSCLTMSRRSFTYWGKAGNLKHTPLVSGSDLLIGWYIKQDEGTQWGLWCVLL